MGEEKTTLTSAQWLVLTAAFLGWMFDGVEIGLFPLAARPALMELLGVTADADISRWIGIVTACFLLGAACGGLAFGWLGDKIGRVRAMVLSILAYSIFTGAGYFATEAWHLGVCRFLASLGMGGEWALAVALVVECWPERHRPKLAGAIGAASNVGFLLIALVAWHKPVTPDSWRWIMLVGASPAVLALVVSLFIPESEKWKAAVKRPGRSPVIEIFSPRLLKTTILAIILASIPLIGTWAAVSGWTPPWAEQMREFQLSQAATTLDPAEIKNQAAQSKAAIQILLAMGAIFGGFVAPVVAGRVGRRPAYFGLCLASLASCAWLYRTFDAITPTFYLATALVGVVTAAFYGWLPLYLPEIFPTRVRATGQGLSYNFGRILAAVGTLHMAELVRELGGDYASAGASITLIYAIGLVVIWFAPETKGRPLPE